LRFCLLGYNALYALKFNRRFGESRTGCYLLHAGFMLGLLFNREDGGDMFFPNIG
jgi:hypothetical protein